MGFYYELHHHSVGADLGKVLQQLLLPLRLGLVLIRPVCQLLRLTEVGVESAKVCARQPYCLGALKRRLQDAALLNCLPFAGGEIERLGLGKCGQGRAIDYSEGQRLFRGEWCAIWDGWCRWSWLLGRQTRALALQRRLCASRRLLVGRLGGRGGSRGGFFAGARPRRPSRLRHFECGHRLRTSCHGRGWEVKCASRALRLDATRAAQWGGTL